MIRHEEINSSKEIYVKAYFEEIASKYDKVNSFISFGQIKRWRKRLIQIADPPKNGTALDVCAGTGEVTLALAEIMTNGKIIGVDFSSEMIIRAKAKLDHEYKKRVEFRIGNAMDLDFPTDSFDVATITFGLRNVENIIQVLSEMKRVVKPGGSILILDLGKPTAPVLRSLYYVYFNYLLPLVGKLLQGSKEPYDYLIESLKVYPDQETLKEILIGQGLKDVTYKDLTGGIAVIHKGVKV